MKVIYVDDERWMIRKFEMECEKMDNVELLKSFEHPIDAIEYVKTNEVNCAFLDISMNEMGGLELSDHLRNIHPEIIIIYVSAYSEYMVEAFKKKEADYFLLKPYTTEELDAAILRAKLLSARQKKKIYIETFGNLNIYKNGEAVHIRSKVAKELLALLVDRRGSVINNKEAFFIMWEDLPCTHENMTRIRKGVLKLQSTLQKEGMADLCISHKGNHRINTAIFDCDYYQFLENVPEAIARYQGKYMTEYPWAEETNGILYDKWRGYL